MHEQSSQSAASPLPVAAPSPGGAKVVQQMEATRRGVRAFLLFRCLLGVILLVLLAGGLLALADWAWVLTGTFRAATLALIVLLTFVVIYRYGVAPWSRFSRHDAAAEVEVTFPDLGQRVRTALEYTEPEPTTMRAWPSLVRALTKETDQRTHQLQLREAVPWHSVRWLIIGVVGLALIHVTLLTANREMRTAALRLFLVPVHYTQLDVIPGNHTVNAGDDLAIRATLAGRGVSELELLYRKAGRDGNWTTRAFAPTKAAPARSRLGLTGVLETVLRNCRDDLHYRVAADSLQSDVYRITVLHPLRLNEFEASIRPPPHTRQPPLVVRERDFRVIEGSRVDFRFTLNRPPRTARLRVVSTGNPASSDDTRTRQIPLDVNGKVLSGALASVNEELQCEIVARTSDRMQLEDNMFRILVEPDHKPSIRFVKPPPRLEVTPTTEIMMRVEAKDDFGTAKVGIVYQIGDRQKEILYLEEHPDQPVSLSAVATLYLERHQLNYQQGLTYFAFAEDNHPAHPHRAVTELQFIDIRPYKREYQLLESGQQPGGT